MLCGRAHGCSRLERTKGLTGETETQAVWTCYATPYSMVTERSIIIRISDRVVWFASLGTVTITTPIEKAKIKHSCHPGLLYDLICNSSCSAIWKIMSSCDKKPCCHTILSHIHLHEHCSTHTVQVCYDVFNAYQQQEYHCGTACHCTWCKNICCQCCAHHEPSHAPIGRNAGYPDSCWSNQGASWCCAPFRLRGSKHHSRTCKTIQY